MVTAMRVLIVEDDERLAEIFRDFIGELGYQLTLTGPWPPYNFVTIRLQLDTRAGM